MRRNARLDIITRAIEGLIPSAMPANLTVTVTETLPGTVGHDGEPHKHTWSGTPAGLAEKIFTALFGHPKPVDDRSPRARAEDAKRARDLVGELGALTDADSRLTSAPWYPVRPGDLVHVHYEQAGAFPAFGETYIVGDAGDGLLGMQLLAHTLPAAVDPAEAEGMAGCFASEASDDPLYEAWFEAGPQRLTIVRDGRPVHIGGAL
jgi:hypothetical protein